MSLEQSIAGFPYIMAFACYGMAKYFKIPVFKVALIYTSITGLIGAIIFYFLNNLTQEMLERDRSAGLTAGLMILIPMGFILYQIFIYWVVLIKIFLFQYFGIPLIKAAYTFFINK